MAPLGLSSALESEPARQLRRKIFRTRQHDLFAVLDAFDTAGVRWWLAGGWGVDALLGRQTRPHNDIDVCIDTACDAEARARSALVALGYRVTVERAESGRLLSSRVVLRDRAGRTIDLLLVATADAAVGRDVTGDPSIPVLPPDSFAIGGIDGRPLPCLSVRFQIDLHLGYAPQQRDRQDMELLCGRFSIDPPSPYGRPVSAEAGPSSIFAELVATAKRLRASTKRESALIVRVPAAQPLVASAGSARAGGLPAHITVTYPFIPPRRLRRSTEHELAELFGRIPSFSFRLDRMGTFPGLVHLPPEPAEPFVDLVQLVERRWPAYPPYGGRHAEVIPHLTIASGVEPADIETTVGPYLPIDARATEVSLMVSDRLSSWSEQARFPLADPESV